MPQNDLTVIKVISNKKVWGLKTFFLFENCHIKWISILLKLQITVFAIFSLNLHHFENSFCFWEASKWSNINSNVLNKSLWCISIVSWPKNFTFESTLIVLGSFCSALLAKKVVNKGSKLVHESKCIESTMLILEHLENKSTAMKSISNMIFWCPSKFWWSKQSSYINKQSL